MSKKYSLWAIFKIKDQATGTLDKIGVKGKAVAARFKGDMAKTEQMMASVGDKIKTYGKYAVGVGLGAIGAGIGVATKQFVDFDAAVTKSGALFKDMSPLSETYASQLEAIGKKSREVAALTEFNAVDTAGAMQKMAMAGLSSEKAMDLLMGTTNLATAAGTDLTTAVDIATDALGAFKMDATSKNLQRISDVMAKTASSFNTDLGPMFEAIQYAGPSFTSAGQSVETLSASIGVLANAGIKGSNAGTALNAVFTQLSNVTKQKQLKGLGINVTDEKGNFLNLFDIVGQLEKKLGGMGNAQKQGILSSIFGERGKRAIDLLMSQGTEGLQKFENELKNATGSAALMADVMRGSIQNKLKVLGSALTELGFKFVDAFAKKGSVGISKLTDAVTRFNPEPIINFFKVAGGEFFRILKILWGLRDVIVIAAVSWGVYKAALIGALAVKNIMDMVGAIRLLMASQQGMNVVQAAFNVLLNANPIGLIVAGVTALILVIREVWSEWDRVTEAFKNNGIGAAIGMFFKLIVSGLLMPIQKLLELLSALPFVGKLIQPAAKKIESWRDSLKGVELETNLVNTASELGAGAVSQTVAKENDLSIVSPAQQAAYYSRQDTYQHAEISVKAEPGTSARVSKPPASPNFNLAVSGSY